MRYTSALNIAPNPTFPLIENAPLLDPDPESEPDGLGTEPLPVLELLPLSLVPFPLLFPVPVLFVWIASFLNAAKLLGPVSTAFIENTIPEPQ